MIIGDRRSLPKQTLNASDTDVGFAGPYTGPTGKSWTAASAMLDILLEGVIRPHRPSVIGTKPGLDVRIWPNSSPG